MGYYSYMTGEVVITPAIPDTDLFAAGFGDDEDRLLYAWNEGEEETVGLVNGVITVIPGKQITKVKYRYDDSTKLYSSNQDVDDLMKLVKAHKASASGVLWISGEETGDQWRYRFDGTKVHTEKPELLWPNGDKGWGG